MKLLLDTHVLIWLFSEPDRLMIDTLELLSRNENQLFFSPASIWEIAIKQRLEREDFNADAGTVYQEALDLGIQELALTSSQTLATLELPLLHHDPLDRILLAQAIHEGFMLLTSDKRLLAYQGPTLKA